MEFHHLGVATYNIKKSIELFAKMGFTHGEIISDEIQNVNVCFLRKERHPDIELIEPLHYNSPVNKILDKIGTTPYHFCYYSDNIQKDIEQLRKNKFIVVINPVKAIALDNKKICFCYHKDFGLLELVEA